MLDDLKMIHERDSMDALGAVEKQWQQLEHSFSASLIVPAGPGTRRAKPSTIQNVIYSGMGGSAISAQLAQSWLSIDRPFEVVRDYDLPAYIGPETLCVIGSYSGNTEESISTCMQAISSGAQVVVLAKGGRLQDLAVAKQLSFLCMPDALEARFAPWYSLMAVAAIFDSYGLTEGRVAELAGQREWFRSVLSQWRPEVPTARNQAKRIALELTGKSIVVCAGPKLAAVAYKWKTGFNENAKQIAWSSQYPECHHNEFVGWTKQPVQKPYVIVDLRSSLENERVQRRFVASEKLLSGVRPSPIVVEPAGDTLLQQMLFAAGLGDFTSVYLSLLNGIDPMSGDIVRKLKQELAE